jgi:hypothetical protein
MPSPALQELFQLTSDLTQIEADMRAAFSTQLLRERDGVMRRMVNLGRRGRIGSVADNSTVLRPRFSMERA